MAEQLKEHSPQNLNKSFGFLVVKKRLTSLLQKESYGELDPKYGYDPALRAARFVWFKHFIPVLIPTLGCIFCSIKYAKQLQWRMAGIGLSFVVGAKLYERRFGRLDLETERTVRALELDSPLAHECREILYNYDPNHWILEKYEKLHGKKNGKKNGDKNGNDDESVDSIEDDIENLPSSGQKNFFSSRWKSKRTEYRNLPGIGDCDDDEIYGKSSFIPEYALPKEELTYATNKFNSAMHNETNNNDNNSNDGNDGNDNRLARHDAVLRPQNKFFAKEDMPEPLAKFVDKEKNSDKNWLEEMGIDNQETQEYLLQDANQADMAQDCWRIEEDYRRCKLLQKSGKTTLRQCQELSKQLRQCRVREHVDELKGLR